MPRETTRDRILKSAYRLFYREGFARVSVDAIADATGVTKRTIYYHFKSKDDIVAAVLNSQHAFALERFKTWAGAGESAPTQTVENLFARLKAWADGADYMGSGFTRISTELADRPGHPARAAASQHKALTEAWLSDLLKDHNIRDHHLIARQIMTLIEGGMSLALIHGSTDYFQAAGSAAVALLKNAE